jgi:tryptophanyl-tRNA synthetase
VLQAADILIYNATKVPVGEDQRQHLELAREIVRKWNARFGETFREPEALYSSTPKILGLDGQAKMSKSLGNTISLREDDEAVWNKLRTAATDPARVRRTDAGRSRQVQRVHPAQVFQPPRLARPRCAPGLYLGGDRLH